MSVSGTTLISLGSCTTRAFHMLGWSNWHIICNCQPSAICNLKAAICMRAAAYIPSHTCCIYSMQASTSSQASCKIGAGLYGLYGLLACSCDLRSIDLQILLMQRLAMHACRNMFLIEYLGTHASGQNIIHYSLNQGFSETCTYCTLASSRVSFLVTA